MNLVESQKLKLKATSIIENIHDPNVIKQICFEIINFCNDREGLDINHV